MARIRMIKPEFFDDTDVCALSFQARLCFIGLWLHADRDGRLVDEPFRLKARIFPFDELDVSLILDELVARKLIRRYTAGDKHGYLWIPNFVKHQRPHPKEPPSLLPAYIPNECESPEKTRQDTAKNVQSVGILDTESETRNLRHGIRSMIPPPELVPANTAASPAPSGRKRPIYRNERFAVHQWQLDELLSMLGAQAEGFDLHEWLLMGAVTKAKQEPGIVPDWWKWLKAQTLHEAEHRGLALATDASVVISAQGRANADAMARASKRIQAREAP